MIFCFLIPLINSDLYLVQSNINSISSWFSSHYLSINTSTTKYMFKPSLRFLSSPPLYLNDSSLELVSSYKYLGVFFSSNLSLSLHIHHICSKSRKMFGLFFRYFYCFSSPSVLFKLYLNCSLRPHLEYCSPVWDPSSLSQITSLEKL